MVHTHAHCCARGHVWNVSQKLESHYYGSTRKTHEPRKQRETWPTFKSLLLRINYCSRLSYFLSRYVSMYDEIKPVYCCSFCLPQQLEFWDCYHTYHDIITTLSHLQPIGPLMVPDSALSWSDEKKEIERSRKNTREEPVWYIQKKTLDTK